MLVHLDTILHLISSSHQLDYCTVRITRLLEAREFSSSQLDSISKHLLEAVEMATSNNLGNKPSNNSSKVLSVFQFYFNF